MDEEIKNAAVLVVGAGIAGIKSALELAETGYKVILIDNSPYVGGILQKLDYQFPTDHCGMCRMLPLVGREHASQFCMRKSLFHDNIDIMPFTELISVEGEAGSFDVQLLKKARWVDTDVCIGTGLCEDVCPLETQDEFNMGLVNRKAIYRPVPHNLPNTYIIDPNLCDKCGKCVEVCPVNAINLDQSDEVETFRVGAIILSSGSDLYDPSQMPILTNYGVSKDVITSLQFERLISSSGAYNGKILRLSDGREAKKIAWIQCCGSRNRKEGRDYCSSVCCMFGLKEAMLALERGGEGTESTIYYMDMRTFGKGFYKYREQAEEKGVKLIRCRPHTVEIMKDKTLRIRVFENGKLEDGIYDLVVLSTGMVPSKDMERICKMLDVKRGTFGFVETSEDMVSTTREGVFACGTFSGPKEIYTALISGTSAAANALKVLGDYGVSYEREDPLPPERDVSRERPLVNVILCKWPHEEAVHNIKLEELAEDINSLHSVSSVHIIDSLCKPEGLEEAKEILGKNQGNRILFGACMPYIYKQRLKRLAEEVGLSTVLVEVTDIRGIAQAILVGNNGADPTKEAYKALIKGIEQLKNKIPTKNVRTKVVKRALIIGGGLAGLKVGLTLAGYGIEVVILEKRSELGGRAADSLKYKLNRFEPIQIVEDLASKIETHPLVNIRTNAELIKMKGSIGNFKSLIKVNDEYEEIEHGVTIVATGGHEAPTKNYGYGKNEKILTQEELEIGLADGKIDLKSLKTVVMIQCVDSREKGAKEYCSKVCCASALKNSLKILDSNPEVKIYILYRDMMSYGFLEQYYSKARSKGVISVTYDLENKPRVESDHERPIIIFEDKILNRPLSVEADLLVLSTGIAPAEGNRSIADLLDVQLDEDGFFQEADPKWRPIDFMKEGIFMCGLAHSPMPIEETLAQATAAAQRAFNVLAKPELVSARVVADVKQAICSLCLKCIETCPFEARFLDEVSMQVKVLETACQGCGICTSTCPNGSSYIPAASTKYTMALIDSTLTI